jgi:hypothetical protein
VKIDPINLKSLSMELSNYYVKLSPIVTIRKGCEDILRFIFIPEPYQIPNGKKIESDGQKKVHAKIQSADIIELDVFHTMGYSAKYEVSGALSMEGFSSIIAANLAKGNYFSDRKLTIIFKGMEVFPYETVRMLRMEDGDMIQGVFRENHSEKGSILLNVLLPHGPIYLLKVDHKNEMMYLFSTVATELKRSIDDTTFIFKGRKLKPYDTVNMLKMKDGDVINCVSNNPKYDKTGIAIMINLIIQGSIHKFNVSQNTLMSNVFSVVDVTIFGQTNSLVLMVREKYVHCDLNGRKVKAIESVRMLEMDEGDTVNCAINQTYKGGFKDDSINVEILFPDILDDLTLDLTAPIEALMSDVFAEIAETLSDYLGTEIFVDDLRFTLFRSTIASYHTAEMLEMVDGDTIVCMRKDESSDFDSSNCRHDGDRDDHNYYICGEGNE